jgi:hypothetical protein
MCRDRGRGCRFGGCGNLEGRGRLACLGDVEGDVLRGDIGSDGGQERRGRNERPIRRGNALEFDRPLDVGLGDDRRCRFQELVRIGSRDLGLNEGSVEHDLHREGRRRRREGFCSVEEGGDQREVREDRDAPRRKPDRGDPFRGRPERSGARCEYRIDPSHARELRAATSEINAAASIGAGAERLDSA